MPRPFNNFEWATDANYTTGPDVGTPTKVAPSSGERDEGFVPDTAAVPQYMNYVLAEIAEWLGYVAGLASDTEFLGDLKTWIEAEDWSFNAPLIIFEHAVGINGTLDVGGKVTTSGQVEVGTLLTVDGNIHGLNDADIDGNLNVDGTTTLRGDITLVGSGTDIIYPSRNIQVQIPITGFSPAMQFTTVWELKSYVGGGTAGYGFNVFGDKLAGSYIFPKLEFTIPNGATLISVKVGYRMSQGGGNHDFGPMTLDRVSGGPNSNNVTQDIAPPFTNAASTSGSTHTFTVTSPSVSDAFDRYIFTVEPSEISDFGDPDSIYKVEVTYSTTHVDAND